MHGDYSRMTYAPSRHYSGVVAQQGRFMLDAELNEQALIVNDYLRRLTTDLVGPFAGPAHHTGFAVEPLSENGKAWGVELSRGHYYVYGLRCEAPAAGSDDGPIRIGEHTPPFIVFIAVWEQSIGAVQDPGLIEPALGPHVPDTTRRLQVRWRPHAAAKLPGTEDLTGLDRNGIAEAFHAYNSDQDRRARLGARTHPGHAADADPSSSPVAAGYSGLENQLYRVEIHHGGDAERATFKWSRDNGSVEIALEGLSGIDEHGLRTATIAPGRHEPRRGLA
ncbi:MAG TPA: DUF6519 domain-containing protein, partial [Solirubrobacteraceae bacterium]|nr:DUF6519 domain-containing protein [Solirubrobacteraceae bacterium]